MKGSTLYLVVLMGVCALPASILICDNGGTKYVQAYCMQQEFPRTDLSSSAFIIGQAVSFKSFASKDVGLEKKKSH